jgi:hypothetical protein
VELRKGLAAIARYLAAYQLPQARTLLRLDGQYGTGAVLTDLGGFAFVTRGKDYRVLDHPLVQAAHASAPRSVPATDCKVRWCAASGTAQKCPWGPNACATAWSSQRDRATKKKSPVGVTRAGVVYELFVTDLPRASVHRL